MIEDKIVIDGALIFMQIMPGECVDPINIEVEPYESVVPGVWLFEHEVFGKHQASGPDSRMVITHQSPPELELKERRDKAVKAVVDLAFKYARSLPHGSGAKNTAMTLAVSIREVAL